MFLQFLNGVDLNIIEPPADINYSHCMITQLLSVFGLQEREKRKQIVWDHWLSKASRLDFVLRCNLNLKWTITIMQPRGKTVQLEECSALRGECEWIARCSRASKMWEITDKEARFSNVCRFLGGDNYYYLGMCPSGCMLGNIQGLFAFQMCQIKQPLANITS